MIEPMLNLEILSGGHHSFYEVGLGVLQCSYLETGGVLILGRRRVSATTTSCLASP